MSEWISVKDKLPKDPMSVLVWAHGYASDYIEISLFFKNEFIINNVTHWMPLPEPPE